MKLAAVLTRMNHFNDVFIQEKKIERMSCGRVQI